MKNPYQWQDADRLAEAVGLSRSTIYNRANHGSRPDEHIIESRVCLPSDNVAGSRKLYRVQPPYYGDGLVTANTSDVSYVTGVDERVVKIMRGTTVMPDGTTIEVHEGPLGSFYVINDNQDSQRDTTDMITTEFMSSSDLAEIIETSTNNITKAGDGDYLIHGQFKIDRRRVAPEEKQHPAQQWVFRATKVQQKEDEVEPLIDSRATDWMTGRELADYLDIGRSTVSSYASTKNLLFGRYKFERRHATAAEKDSGDFGQCRTLYRAVDMQADADTQRKRPALVKTQPLRPVVPEEEDEAEQSTQIAVVVAAMAAGILLLVLASQILLQ